MNHPHGRIGPNAIIQTVAALRERRGAEVNDLLIGWGRGELIASLPTDMVEEQEVTRLCAQVVQSLGHVEGMAVLERSGALTAEYLLKHRIPWIARMLLPWLPYRMAVRALFRAIQGHSWTFAGTGIFTADAALPGFAIGNCPICRELGGASGPACGYYRATFEGLLRRLVGPAVSVVETACAAMGGGECRFRVYLDERGVP
jgi:divinyl protochlorophyllide a 8-vinyl-reductase